MKSFLQKALKKSIFISDSHRTEWEYDNIQNGTHELIQAIVRCVSPYRGVVGLTGMTIYAISQPTQVVVTQEHFVEDLKQELENRLLTHLSKGVINIKTEGHPKASIQVFQNQLFLELHNQANIIPAKAIVCAVKGCGTLELESYVLDSTVKSTYSIGRGHMSNDGFYRPNDIVIKADDQNIEQKKKNSYVSSSQAVIIIHNGEFYIQAKERGCRNAGGSATKVIRGENKTELLDVNMKVKLCHDDIIELGKEVLLKFCIENSLG